MPAHLIAEEGPYRGLVLNLEEGEEWVVGRDPDTADFVVEDSTVSRKHARLNKKKEGVYLKNLSRVNPTLVNDLEISEQTLLKEGDRIQIGNTVFLYSEENIPDLSEPPQKKPAPKEKEKKGGYDDIFGEEEEEAEEELPPLSPAAEFEEDPLPEEKEEEEAPPQKEMTAYDTIFDDTGEEAELPFNLLSETPLILKVISGPNAGAEIGIEKGRSYTIGKDPNSCDIVFQDLSVSRNHTRLTVSTDGELTIEDLTSKNGTVVNGVPITERTAVTPQDLIALGTTVFLIIDREAPQETIYSPMVPSYDAPKVVEAEEDREEVAAAPKTKDWRKETIPTKHLLLAGSLVAIFLVAFLSFFSLFKSKGLEMVRAEPVSEIKTALERFKEVQYTFNPASGKLFLVGHVLTAVDYAEMLYNLDQIDFIASIDDTVIIDEYVWKSMNDIITANAPWRGVNIGSPMAGKFVANGYVVKSDEAAKLSDYLNVNFPYLDRLKNRVVVEEALTTQLQSMLAGSGLGAVTLQLTGGEAMLSGRYNENMEKEIKILIKEISMVPGVTGVKNFAVPTPPHLAAIDVSGQFQVGGSSEFDGRGYSVVLNGKIYTLGDAIEGMKITEIEQSTILLEKDGLKYKIDYTR